MLAQTSTTDLLAKIISIPSKTTEEKKLSVFILEWLARNGVAAKRQGENVVAHIKGLNRSKALIFNGHIDTVATGPLEAWKQNPLEPVIKKGIMNGLGASDMKAGVAVFMELATYYSKNTPACDLWFSFVVGEEVDGRGSQSFVEWFTKQPLFSTYSHIEALIGEPTNNAFLGVGHRGNLFIEILVTGDNYYKANVATAEIMNAGIVLNKLKILEASWKKKFEHEYLGSPSIGVTSINTIKPGKKSNKCSVVMDIRTVPKLHSRAVGLLETFCSKLPFHADVELLDGCPAGWTESSSELRRLFRDVYPEAPQQVLGGSADLCFFTEMNIDTVIFGPGQRDKMHAANESFEISKLPQYQKIIKNVVTLYGEA